MDEEKLVEDNLNIVHYVLHKIFDFHSDYSDYDDLFQIGCMGLLFAIRSYNDSVPFVNYAVVVVKNEITTYLRRHDNRYKKLAYVSLERDVSEDSLGYDSMHYFDTDCFVKKLTDNEKDLCNWLIYDGNVNEYAATHGLTHNNTSFRLKKIRKKYIECYGSVKGYRDDGAKILNKRGTV